jgi:hypothetical protein
MLKIRSYQSLEKEIYTPIRSLFCRKFLNILSFYIVLKRLLNYIRTRAKGGKYSSQLELSNIKEHPLKKKRKILKKKTIEEIDKEQPKKTKNLD